MTIKKEIDYFWDKLSESVDTNAQQCGWLNDKFGVHANYPYNSCRYYVKRKSCNVQAKKIEF